MSNIVSQTLGLVLVYQSALVILVCLVIALLRKARKRKSPSRVWLLLTVPPAYILVTSLVCGVQLKKTCAGYAAPVSVLRIGEKYPLLAVKSDGGRAFVLVVEPKAGGSDKVTKPRLVDLTTDLPETIQYSILVTNGVKFLRIVETGH
jgi:hypothetical protein